ncbi:MAG: hypothetical protein OXH69_19365 [Acidobacteria bacterium]|nr:hypothetical protein [Acidobacteriota bacterium]
MPKQFPLWKALITVGIMALVFVWAAEEYRQLPPILVVTAGAGAIVAGVLLAIK